MAVNPEFESDAENCVAYAEERGRGMFEATYDPQDDKLRLRASRRLGAEDYEKVKAAGFRWAPKQELFFAIWSPDREDLLTEMAGEIEDEDTTLVDRAEARAERFEEYGDNREADAKSAAAAVQKIADGIPLGQPILVGHHSERHARRDAERIRSGMSRAVKMWDTAQYWRSRAEGALRAAKYKELPAVRHRRIKGIESDKRKMERNKAEAEKWLKLWSLGGLDLETARRVANVCWLHLPRKEGDDPKISDGPTAYDVLRPAEERSRLYIERTLDEVVEHAKVHYPARIGRCERWIAHYDNRLAYERAMLDEQIGTGELGRGMEGRFDMRPGGKVLVRDGWATILRVNKVKGVVNSVSATCPAGVTWRGSWKYGVEQIKDYQPPTEERAAAVAKATKQPPITNYPAEGAAEMTDAEWRALMKRKWSDFPYYGVVEATSTAGKHRVRQRPGPHLSRVRVFITDAKRVDPPKPEAANAKDDQGLRDREGAPTPIAGANLADGAGGVPAQDMQLEPRPQTGEGGENDGWGVIEAMRTSLKAGVHVAAVPNLFPTPPEVAHRAALMAGIASGDRVLEPSAGTGNLVEQIREMWPGQIILVERNLQLAAALTKRYAHAPWAEEILAADFLDVTDADVGTFDKIVMNPPFENGADIKHVEHALKFLRPGGRLVAIIADGPRQEKAFRGRAAEWEELPSGTFEGTGVRSVLMAIDKKDER